jgi:hypothetical protein
MNFSSEIGAIIFSHTDGPADLPRPYHTNAKLAAIDVCEENGFQKSRSHGW